MEEAILNFNKQFAWKPVLGNPQFFTPKTKVIVCGMGGSALAVSLIKKWKPELEIFVHQSYGLPALPEKVLEESLLIASSYSGNTEEVLDFLDEGYSRGYNMAVIATGGDLLAFAEKNNIDMILETQHDKVVEDIKLLKRNIII
jgi:glucose/mannose-6-phosphate isomerase